MTIVRRSLDKAKLDKAALKRLAAMKDKDIDYSDIPELDDAFFQKAALHMPRAKKQLTIRFDEDVLEWFKAQGKGYQSRMNAVLRAYYESRRSPDSKRT